MGDYGALSARHYDLITLMDAPVDQYHINCCSQARQGFHLKEKENFVCKSQNNYTGAIRKNTFISTSILIMHYSFDDILCCFKCCFNMRAHIDL